MTENNPLKGLTMVAQPKINDVLTTSAEMMKLIQSLPSTFDSPSDSFLTRRNTTATLLALSGRKKGEAVYRDGQPPREIFRIQAPGASAAKAHPVSPSRSGALTLAHRKIKNTSPRR